MARDRPSVPRSWRPTLRADSPRSARCRRRHGAGLLPLFDDEQPRALHAAASGGGLPVRPLGDGTGRHPSRDWGHGSPRPAVRRGAAGHVKFAASAAIGLLEHGRLAGGLGTLDLPAAQLHGTARGVDRGAGGVRPGPAAGAVIIGPPAWVKRQDRDHERGLYLHAWSGSKRRRPPDTAGFWRGKSWSTAVET